MLLSKCVSPGFLVQADFKLVTKCPSSYVNVLYLSVHRRQLVDRAPSRYPTAKRTAVCCHSTSSEAVTWPSHGSLRTQVRAPSAKG